MKKSAFSGWSKFRLDHLSFFGHVSLQWREPRGETAGPMMSRAIELFLASNLHEIKRLLLDLEKQQLPFATALALTRTAQQAKADLRSEMQKRFDRPTPYTLNSLYVKPATKRDLVASVEIKDDLATAKGNAAAKYLAPEIEGGARNMKGFELGLSGQSGGMFIIPSKQAKLDQYGNLSLGQIRKIRSRLSAANGAGFTANIGDQTRAKLAKRGLLNYWTKGKKLATSDYFIAFSKRSNKPLGVYQFLGKHRVTPILIFTDKQPSYSKRLPFDDIVLASVQRTLMPALDAALAKAIATAKVKADR